MHISKIHIQKYKYSFDTVYKYYMKQYIIFKKENLIFLPIICDIEKNRKIYIKKKLIFRKDFDGG